MQYFSNGIFSVKEKIRQTTQNILNDDKFDLNRSTPFGIYDTAETCHAESILKNTFLQSDISQHWYIRGGKKIVQLTQQHIFLFST